MWQGSVVVGFVEKKSLARALNIFLINHNAIFAMSKKRKVSRTFKGTRELLQGEPLRLIERIKKREQGWAIHYNDGDDWWKDTFSLPKTRHFSSNEIFVKGFFTFE